MSPAVRVFVRDACFGHNRILSQRVEARSILGLTSVCELDDSGLMRLSLSIEIMADVTDAQQTEKLFSWPTPQDYNEAVQSPAFCFNDAELKTGVTELNEFGLPRPISGGFASVYHVRNGEREFAVRCFLSRVSNLQFRYEAITEHLAKARAPWAVPCEFISQGMLVGSTWFPILKMEWIKGDTLGGWIEKNLDDPLKLCFVREQFVQVVAELKRHGIAHGDLQPANILVMSDGSVKLVDYDGMFVPALSGARANELGHKNFQHPQRSAVHFDVDVDRFSAWLIATALDILAFDPKLWQLLNCGDDALLFRSVDLADPDHSYTFSVLEVHENEEIVRLARMIRTLCRGELGEVPSLLDSSVEVDVALPPVEYTEPPQADDASIERFQVVPRRVRRGRRGKRRATKSGGGAMAAISASIAAGLALDNARTRRTIVYPTLAFAALIVIGTISLRLLSADTRFVYDWLHRQFEPPGQALLEAAKEAYGEDDLNAANVKYSQIIARFNEPKFGLGADELIDVFVHRAEIEHRFNRDSQAKADYAEAERLSRWLRTHQPWREAAYDLDYFAEQQLICDIGDVPIQKVADGLTTLFAKNPASAGWTSWDLERVFSVLANKDVTKAVQYWNAWHAAAFEDTYSNDSGAVVDMTNLAFSTAYSFIKDDNAPAKLDGGRQIYQMIIEAADNYTDMRAEDRLDAMEGLYYIAVKRGDKKAQAELVKQLKDWDADVSKESLEEYSSEPPFREYNPRRS